MLGISVSTSDDAPGMVELVMSEDTSSPSSFEETDEETCELQDKDVTDEETSELQHKNVITEKEQYEHGKQSVAKKLEMRKLESMMSEDTTSTSSSEETDEETCDHQDKTMITEKEKYKFRFERLYEYGKQSVAKKLEMQKLKIAQERHRETVFRKKFFKIRRYSVRC